MVDKMMRSVYLNTEVDGAIKQIAWQHDLSASAIIQACVNAMMARWRDDPDLMADDLKAQISDPDKVKIPYWEKKAEEVENWRARRLTACRAIDQLRHVVDNLGKESGAYPLPQDSTPNPISKEMRAEINNSLTVLLRTILLFNDGRVSPAQLQRF